jgi:hypothetical protein
MRVGPGDDIPSAPYEPEWIEDEDDEEDEDGEDCDGKWYA